MNADCIDNEENVLITPDLLVDALACKRKRPRGRWPEWERQALKLAPLHQKVLNACVKYARKRVRGRWEEFEPVLLQAFISNPVVGREYVEDCYEVDVIGEYVWGYLDVINECWPDWEQAIVGLAATNIDLLYSCVRYTKERMKKRWDDLETLLLRAVLTASQSYAWNGAEPLGLEWSLVFDYTAEVVRGPWQELEAAILGHGCLPTLGVSYVIGGSKSRWHGLEERMLGPGYGSPLCDQIGDIVQYAAHLLKGCPWPEAERFFLGDLRQRSPSAAASAAANYAQHVIKGQWAAGEELLSRFPFDMYQYARFTLKRPLPEHLHMEMVMRSFATPDDHHIKDYFKWCDEQKAAAQGGAP